MRMTIGLKEKMEGKYHHKTYPAKRCACSGRHTISQRNPWDGPLSGCEAEVQDLFC